jgi:pantothenate kinase type III
MPDRAIGRNTQESLQAGILLGTAGMVDALVRRIARELGRKPHVIATGGLAPVVAPACETVDRVDEWLTLHGLRLIHEQVGRSTRRQARRITRRQAAGGNRGKAARNSRRQRS